MGFKGYDWKESNDVFEGAARFSRGGMLNYHPLVVVARQQGKKGHELLREMGTTGIQTPIRLVDGQLVGTKRLHDTTLELGPPQGPTVHPKWLTHFDTKQRQGGFEQVAVGVVQRLYERIKPRGDELWVTNGRVNEVWQSAFDDMRKPYMRQRWPDHFIEIHPDDAGPRGIESGDEVLIVNDDVLIQTGGFSIAKGDDFLFTKLQEKGLIRQGRGEFTAVAIVTDAVRPGVLFANFLSPRWPGAAANSVVHRVPDPITLRYRFKLGKGRVSKIGESPYKRSFDEMTFKPRTII